MFAERELNTQHTPNISCPGQKKQWKCNVTKQPYHINNKSPIENRSAEGLVEVLTRKSFTRVAVEWKGWGAAPTQKEWRCKAPWSSKEEHTQQHHNHHQHQPWHLHHHNSSNITTTINSINTLTKPHGKPSPLAPAAARLCSTRKSLPAPLPSP